MRKTMLAVGLMLVVATFMACVDSVTSPSLVGKWTSDSIKTVEDGGTMMKLYKFAFNEDSTMTLLVDASMESSSEGVSIYMPFSIDVAAKWCDKDSVLIWVPADSAVNVKLNADSMRMTFDKPEMEALGDKMKKSMVESFEKEGKNEFAAGYNKSDTVKYVLDGDKLTLYIDEDTVKLTREAAPQK